MGVLSAVLGCVGCIGASVGILVSKFNLIELAGEFVKITIAYVMIGVN